jgi:hypothetical protein
LNGAPDRIHRGEAGDPADNTDADTRDSRIHDGEVCTACSGALRRRVFLERALGTTGASRTDVVGIAGARVIVMLIAAALVVLVILAAVLAIRRRRSWRARALKRLSAAGCRHDAFLRVCRIADDLRRNAPRDAVLYRTDELLEAYVRLAVVDEQLLQLLWRATAARTAARPRSAREIEQLRNKRVATYDAMHAIEELLLLYLGRSTMPSVDEQLSGDEVGWRLSLVP